MTGQDIGASVRARLLNKAKAERQDFNLVLTRYALERLLYRLGASRYAERFLLKGALLFDLWVLARQADFDGDTLARAIRATFDRRATPLPDGVPFGLTEDFAQDRQKQAQWRAFLGKNALAPMPLADVLDLLRGFLMPPLGAAGAGASQVGHWRSSGGWC